MVSTHWSLYPVLARALMVVVTGSVCGNWWARRDISYGLGGDAGEARKVQGGVMAQVREAGWHGGLRS